MPDDAGTVLALSRRGTGPPLLLLHGVATDRREFSQVLPALASRYDVLAVDLPGHGRSPSLPRDVPPDIPALTDAVEATLDRERVGAPHVLGISLGGRLGLELARRGRALSVVAIGPTGLALPVERAHQAAMFGVARLGYSALDRVADDVMRLPGLRAVALGLLRARGWRTPADEAVALVRGFSRTPEYWRVLRHAVVPEATWDYSGVDCPVVLAQGMHDVLSLGQVVRLLPLVPGARFRLLPGAGHSAVGDVPVEVLWLVDEAAGQARRPPG